jgi:plastocyanin
MRRALAAAGVLALACAMGVAVPAGSGASSTAKASGKSKCKHRHPHHPKRCRKKVSSESPSVGGGAGGGTDGSTDSSSPPGRLLATEREVSSTQLQLQLSRPSLPAGSAIVEQYNAGSDPHNLILEQNGFVAFSFDTLDPGGDARQTVTLKRGTYTLYCSLLDHRSLGMQATLTVN